MELDRVPLWRGDHVSLAQLVEDFARYFYLPRLAGPDVLVEAVRDGLALLLWQQEGFAYADGYDETEARYRGLRTGQLVHVSEYDLSGLLIKPEAAVRQLEQERPPEPRPPGGGVIHDGGADQPYAGGTSAVAPPREDGAAAAKAPTRYHGTVVVDPTRAGRDVGRVADEVLAHLTGLVGASVKVTLEIDATIPGGAPEHVVRVVTANGRDLKFTPGGGFEEE